MLRMIYYIIIDGIDVYKSCGKGPRLKNMLHNLYKFLDKCPTSHKCFFFSFNSVFFLLRAIYYIVIDGWDVYKSSGIGPRIKICYLIDIKF